MESNPIAMTRILSGLLPGITAKYSEHLDALTSSSADIIESPDILLPHSVVWRVACKACATPGRPQFLKDNKEVVGVINTLGTTVEEVKKILTGLNTKLSFSDDMTFEDLGDDLVKVKYSPSEEYLKASTKSVNKNSNVYKFSKNLTDCGAIFWTGSGYLPSTILGVMNGGVGISRVESGRGYGSYRFAVPDDFKVSIDFKVYAEYIMVMNGMALLGSLHRSNARQSVTFYQSYHDPESIKLVHSVGSRLHITFSTKLSGGVNYTFNLCPNLKDLKSIMAIGVAAFINMKVSEMGYKAHNVSEADPNIIRLQGYMDLICASLNKFKADGTPKSEHLAGIMDEITDNAPFLVTQTLTPGLSALVNSVL